MEATLNDLVLHFGCRDKPGHFLTFPSGMTVRDFECDRLKVPRDHHLDGSYLFLPRPEVGGTGAVTYLPANDRTVLAWWDTTFDGRGGCNMAIIVSGKADAQECWRRFSERFAALAAKLQMPTIVRGAAESQA